MFLYAVLALVANLFQHRSQVLQLADRLRDQAARNIDDAGKVRSLGIAAFIALHGNGCAVQNGFGAHESSTLVLDDFFDGLDETAEFGAC